MLTGLLVICILYMYTEESKIIVPKPSIHGIYKVITSDVTLLFPPTPPPKPKKKKKKKLSPGGVSNSHKRYSLYKEKKKSGGWLKSK